MDSNMMDVDYDISLDVEPGMEPERQQTEQPAVQTIEARPNDNTDEPIPAAYFENLEETVPYPEALNLQGVDELGPNAPIDWALEHFPERRPERLRWINDTSVNILYYDAQSASEALVALTSPEAGDPSSIPAQESRIARPYSLNPDVTLRVRQANSGDQKPRKAGQRSEYYKRYPQARERAPKRERREEAPQYLDYDGNGSGERNGRSTSFDEAMYDDVPPARDSGRGRQNGTRERSVRDRGDRNNVDRYRPRSNSPRESRFGRLRGRSASPDSEEVVDGRLGFAEDGTANRHYRSRSRGDRRRRSRSRDRDHRPRRSNLETDRWEKDRFEDNSRWTKPSTNGRHSIDTFPHKEAMSNHRRSDAHDETNSKGSLLSRMTKDGKPLAPVRSLASRITRDEPAKGSLLSRITRGNDESNYGRLKDDYSTPQDNDFEEPVSARGDLASRISRGKGRGNSRRHLEQDNGFNIRGTAPQQEDFAIRGAAGGA